MREFIRGRDIPTIERVEVKGSSASKFSLRLVCSIILKENTSVLSTEHDSSKSETPTGVNDARYKDE